MIEIKRAAIVQPFFNVWRQEMFKRLWMPMVLLLVGGGLLLAATASNGLPEDYWQQPQAKAVQSSHDWSKLEKNMRPEACAQCHQAQFNAWKHSRHAQAYSPGMVGQFADMGHAGGNDCLVCHAPLQQQLYTNEAELNQSIATLLKHPQGFDAKADLESKQAALPLRHSGVSCAVCHVRQGERFGPPRRNSEALGKQQGAAHGGFTASDDFEKSSLCASCHQFPQEYAINGKPLENTVFEWENSSFSKRGIQCQTCHMPDRKHAFKGIHDVDMVRSGLQFDVSQQAQAVSLRITSSHIGHAFPTYVTPKVMVRAKALDEQGKVLQQWQWQIIREVAYDGDWQEVSDTRIQAGESRIFSAQAPAQAKQVVFSVDVQPDYYYKGVYQSLLADGMKGHAGRLIQRALDEAKGRDYRLYEKAVKLAK